MSQHSAVGPAKGFVDFIGRRGGKAIDDLSEIAAPPPPSPVVIPPNLTALSVLIHFSNQPYPLLWALHRRMR